MLRKRIFKVLIFCLIMGCAWFNAGVEASFIVVEAEKAGGDVNGCSVTVLKKVTRTVRGIEEERWARRGSGSLKDGYLKLDVKDGEYKVKFVCNGTVRESSPFDLKASTKTMRFELSAIRVKLDTRGVSAPKGTIELMRESTPKEIARKKGKWVACHRVSLWLERGKTFFSTSVLPGKYKVKVTFNGSNITSDPFVLRGKAVRSFGFETGSVEPAIGPGSTRIFAHIIVMARTGEDEARESGKEWKQIGIVVYNNDRPKKFLLLPGEYKLALKLKSAMAAFAEFEIDGGDSRKFRFDAGVIRMKVRQDKGYVKGEVNLFRKSDTTNQWNRLSFDSLHKSGYTAALPTGTYKLVLKCTGLKKEHEFSLDWNDTKNFDYEVGNIRISLGPGSKMNSDHMIWFKRKTESGEWKRFRIISWYYLNRLRGEMFPVFPGEYKVELRNRSQVIDSRSISIEGLDVVEIKF